MPDDPPGQVFAVQLTGPDPFVDDWVTRVLLDDIRPQPTFPPNPPGALGRLAPGRAGPFYPREPVDFDAPHQKPWIAVGGDEAAKLWILRPESDDPDDWSYDSAVLFDINDAFGPNTTQTLTDTGLTISTIGRVAVRYQKNKNPELFMPIFEAKEIRVYRFDDLEDDQDGDEDEDEQGTCPDDVLLPCPVF